MIGLSIKKSGQWAWVPACGKTEKPFQCKGKTYLYLYSSKHRCFKTYLCLCHCQEDDLFMDREWSPN